MIRFGPIGPKPPELRGHVNYQQFTKCDRMIRVRVGHRVKNWLHTLKVLKSDAEWSQQNHDINRVALHVFPVHVAMRGESRFSEWAGAKRIQKSITFSGAKYPTESVVGRRTLFVLPAAWRIGGFVGLTVSTANPSAFLTAITFLLLGGLVAMDAKSSLHLTTALAGILSLLHGYLSGAGWASPALLPLHLSVSC